jgi:hypothetical protein
MLEAKSSTSGSSPTLRGGWRRARTEECWRPEGRQPSGYGRFRHAPTASAEALQARMRSGFAPRWPSTGGAAPRREAAGLVEVDDPGGALAEIGTPTLPVPIANSRTRPPSARSASRSRVGRLNDQRSVGRGGGVSLRRCNGQHGDRRRAARPISNGGRGSDSHAAECHGKLVLEQFDVGDVGTGKP